jgi:hypothetical protein
MDSTLKALTQQVDVTNAAILDTLYRLRNPSTINVNLASEDDKADEPSELGKRQAAVVPQVAPGVRIQQVTQLSGGAYKLSIKAPNTLAPMIAK